MKPMGKYIVVFRVDAKVDDRTIVLDAASGVAADKGKFVAPRNGPASQKLGI